MSIPTPFICGVPPPPLQGHSYLMPSLLKGTTIIMWQWDQFRFLGNCSPSSPVSQQFALSEK